MPRQMGVIQIVSLGALIGLAVWLIAWAYTRASYPIRNSPVAGNKIIAFGDSLVVGVGATSGRDFVSILSSRIKRPIVNAGVSGDTTTDALARIDTILEQQPDLVIVMLGGNDALQRVPPDQALANLRAIIMKIQNRGAAVFVLGVRGGIMGDPYHRRLAKLARELHAAYQPNVLDGIFGNNYLMSDEIHPNNRGYGVMAERVWPMVENLLQR